MDLKVARKSLKEGLLADLVWDYTDFRSKYLLAVKTLERSKTAADRRLLSEAYCDIGDVWEFLGAPKRASFFYRKSLKLADNAYAFVELVRRTFETGGSSSALRMVSKAAPAVRKSEDYRELIEDIDRGVLNCVYRQGDPVWSANEALARHQPRKALECVGRLRRVAAVRKRAAAYSVQGNLPAALREWSTLAVRKEDVLLCWDDWFYLSKDLYENLEFWRLLKSIVPRLSLRGLIFPFHESIASELKGGSRTKQHKLFVEFQILRLSGDWKRGKHLLKKYPFWTELRELLSEGKLVVC